MADMRNVFEYRPGITGLGQINEVDMSTPKKPRVMISLMLQQRIIFYCYFILVTVTGKGQGIGRVLCKNYRTL